MTSNRQPRQRGMVADGLLVLGTVAIGWVLIEPGIFSVDESHYLLASHAVAERASFQVENGYEQVREPSLLFFYTVVPAWLDSFGTVATVPPYHALLAAPWLLAAGLDGLILLELVCFGLTLVAVRRLAVAIHPEGRFPLAAAAAFGLGTFSLEYALGIWPHALSQALFAWCLLLLVTASGPDRHPARSPVLPALAAGLLGGLAVGVRLQNVVMLPIVALAASLVMRLPLRALGAHLAGWVVPLVGHALINHARFGTYNPFTYGAPLPAGSLSGRLMTLLVGHAWLLLAALAACLSAWWLWHRTRRRAVWLGLALAGLAALLLLPPTRSLLGGWLSSAGFHLVDTSLVAAGRESAGAHLNELGQALYGGVLKKSLLEVVPWLAMVPVVLLARSSLRPPYPVRFLAVVGLGGVLVLPLILSPGGMCYNPRYLLEMLPALVPVALWGAYRLASSRRGLLAGAAVGVAAALPVLFAPGRVDAPAGGWWPMVIPLAAAALLAATASLAALACGIARRAAAAATAVLFAAGLVYGGLVHLGVDVATSLSVRRVARRMAEEAGRVLPAPPGPALLVTWKSRKDVFSPLKLERNVWIADGAQAEEPVRLLDAAGADRRVFVLANGIPPHHLQAWIASRKVQRHEHAGLVFLEMLREVPP